MKLGIGAKLLAGIIVMVMVSIFTGSFGTILEAADTAFMHAMNGTSVDPLQLDTLGKLKVASTPAVEAAGSWATARTNVATNDSATTYGTNDSGNFSVSGYNKVRFRIFMNATADSMTFACGSATPVTNPYYGYTPTVTVSGYSTTSPFTCSCDTNGQTVMFPRVTGLSSGGNVTAIKYQAYN